MKHKIWRHSRLFLSLFVVSSLAAMSIQMSIAGPPTNINLQSANPAEAGYTNNQNINFSFNHDPNDNAFQLLENAAPPPCGGMANVNNPPTGPEAGNFNLTAGDGAKNVFVHLVDHNGDGCGGNPDIFTNANQNIVLDTNQPANPNPADFSYDFQNDASGLANAIVDAGSGLDFQVDFTPAACNTLANNWQDGVNGGSGFAFADGAGIPANPGGFFGAPGGNVNDNVCIRVRDRAGNVSAFVTDGQVPTPPNTGGVAAGANPINTIDNNNVNNVSVDVVFPANPPAGQVFVTLTDPLNNSVNANGAANVGGTTTTVAGINASALSNGVITVTVGFQDGNTGHTSTTANGVNANKLSASGGGRRTDRGSSSVSVQDSDASAGGAIHGVGDVNDQTIPEEVTSCGCTNQYASVSQFYFDATDNTGLSIEGLQCFNPVCTDTLGTTFVEDTPAESTFRDAFRDKIDAGKAMSDATDAVIKARKKYEQAEGQFQDARIDRYQGKGNQADYDAKKAKRDAAWRNLKDAERIENDAKNDYNQAYWHEKEVSEDSDLIDPDRRRQIIEEELSGGRKTTANAVVPFAFSCFDVSCGSSIDPLDTQAWEAATQEFNICLESCGVPENQQLVPFEYDSAPSVANPGRRGVNIDDFQNPGGVGGNSADDYDGIFGQRYDSGSDSFFRNQEFDIETYKNPAGSGAGCGCETEYEDLSTASEFLVIDNFFDPNQFGCYNPICLDIDFGEDNPPGDSPAEAAYRDAFRDKIDAGKKLSEARDKVIKTRKEYEEAEGEFQDARLDRYEGIGSQSDYDSKKAKRDAAWRKYQDARRAENDAQNGYNQAHWKFKELSEDEDLIELDTRRQIIEEELDASRNQITITDIANSCFDPVCGIGASSSSYTQNYVDALNVYNGCVQQCESPNTVVVPHVFDTSGRVTDADSLSRPVHDTSLYTTYTYDTEEPLDERGNANDIDIVPEYDSITRLYEERTVHGVDGGNSFDPFGLIDRSAFTKIVVNTAGYDVPERITANPFPDVPFNSWYAPYYYSAKQNGVLNKGNPAENINLAEALTVGVRTFDVDFAYHDDYLPDFLVGQPELWWHPVAKWAVANGVIEDKKDLDASKPITRAQAADVIVKVRSASSWKNPCNCDKEKAAYEQSKANTKAAEDKAAASKAKADKSEAAAKEAEDAAKKANDKVSDLEKFFDDSSSVTNSDGEKITTGDLHLLREVSKGIFDQWAAGDITAEEASEAWEGNNKDKLDELRAKKADELKDARKEATEANNKAGDKRATADADKAQADKDEKAAADARKKEADAKKALEECEERCKIVNAKAAEERRIAAAKARAAAIKRAAEAKRKRDEARRNRDAERKRRQREQAAAAATTSQPASTSSTSGGGGGGGPIPAASKDPCKEKLTQAIVARGKQIAKTRPDDAGDVALPKSATKMAVTVGKGIKAAAAVAIKGGSTTLMIAKAVSANVTGLYTLWAEYVGNIARDAGTRIINNRRVCGVIKHSTKGVCGYEVFPPGQVVYWQKDAAGNYKVMVMGPGDNVTEGQCK